MLTIALLARLQQEYPLALPPRPACFCCGGAALADCPAPPSANLRFGLPYGPPQADRLYFCCAPGVPEQSNLIYYGEAALTLPLYQRMQQLLAPQQEQEYRLAALDRACLTLHELDDFTKEAGRLLGNPLMVVDKTMTTLSLWPKQPIGIDSWDRIYQHGYASDADFAQADRQMQEFCQADDVVSPCILPYQEPDGRQIRRLVGATQDPRNGQHCGGIELIELYHPFSPEDMALAERLCQLLSRYLAHPLISGRNIGQEEQLLHALLYTEPGQREAMAKKLKHQRLLPAKGPWYLANIPLSAAHRLTATPLRGLLAEEYPNSWSLVLEDAILLLIRAEDTAEAAASLAAQLADTGRRLDLAVVLSTPFCHLLDLPANWRLTAAAAQTAGYQNAHPGCLTVTSLYVKTFFYTATKSADLRPLIPPVLYQLADYDKKHDTQLLDTLRVYLEEEGDLNRAAARLFVHRNTLAYRIQRVQDITHFCLQESDVRQLARIGCHLWAHYYADERRH